MKELKELLAYSEDIYILLFIILLGIIGWYTYKILQNEDLEETLSADNPYHRGIPNDEELEMFNTDRPTIIQSTIKKSQGRNKNGTFAKF